MNLSNHLKKYDTLIFAAIGFYLIYLYTKHSGIGISPDSIMYLSAARHFNAYGTFIAYNDLPISYFPLLYPLLLGVLQFITHIDPFTLAPVINAVLFSILIYMSGYIMQRFTTPSVLYKGFLLIAIALSPVLLLIYTYLWSETLFIVFILLFFIAYRGYALKHTINTLLIAAIIAALGTVTRYAGITIIGTGGLLLLLDRYLPIKKKIVHIVIYSVTSCSLLVLNLIRNACLTQFSTGPREPSVTPFFKNVYYLGEVLCNWFNMQEKYYYLALPIALLILITIIGLFLYNIFTRKTNTYEHITLTFTIIYAFFMVVSATISHYQQLDDRLLAPLFIPLLWSCTYWMVKLIKKVRFKVKRTVAWWVFALIMLFFLYNELYMANARYYAESGYGVPGYSDDGWNKSPLVNFLKQHPSIYKTHILLYTNADEAFYFITGVHSVTVPDLPFDPKSKFFAIKHYYLVWFDNSDNDELISLKDIMQREKLIKLHGFKDGAIYEYKQD